MWLDVFAEVFRCDLTPGFEHGDIEPDALADDGFDLVVISTFTAQAPASLTNLRAWRTVSSGETWKLP